MRRLVPAAFCFIVACALVACGLGGNGVSRIPGGAGAIPSVAREPSRPMDAPAGTVALHGIVSSARSGHFILRTRSASVEVKLASIAIVRGKVRDGAFAQVVGRGVRPDHARYAAFWNAPPPSLSVAGRIESSSAVGFALLSTASSTGTIVVLSSSTKTPPSLNVGDSVTVDGFGSLARGIVATRIAAAATPTPTPTVVPTATPTPNPTPTPKPTPTPVPTPTPKPTPTPTPVPTPRGYQLAPGQINGADNLFTPPDSDSPSGGQGQMVDGIPCAPSMSENAYHVHVLIGFYVNGKQVAMPDQVGLYEPGQPVDGYTNTAKCFYYIHTHDASGVVHIESPSAAPRNTSLFQLQNVLDVWGMSIGPNNVGPFAGTVRTFIGQAKYGTTEVYPSSYKEYFGSPGAIALYSHMAIWFEVGPPYVDPPPEIVFYNEY